MAEIACRIREIEEELGHLPIGYISKKLISGKDRYYLQWLENGKLKSKYIKMTEFETILTQVERRKMLQEELKALKETPAGVREQNLKRKAARNMISITGTLMSENRVIATVKDGEITDYDDTLIPLFLKRTEYVEGWLASRAIDTHRTNSRLLKRALRLRTADDARIVLAVNAATVTDRYWFKPEGSTATYADVRFRDNYFDSLALYGDPDGFSHMPSRTPELTNTGSYEKCWRLIDGEWWMYKSGNENEYFSELFICKLGEKLGLDMAHYEMDGKYIRSKNFTDGTEYNFEPISSIMGDDDNYSNCFDAINAISPVLAEQYLRIVWFDTVCYNMDRHTANFGFLRDVKSGAIVKMAPNYDNNIALISRGYPSSSTRQNDGLIRSYREFLSENEAARELYRRIELPQITAEMIEQCFAEIPIDVDKSFVEEFILNGQSVLRQLIASEDIFEEETGFTGMTL